MTNLPRVALAGLPTVSAAQMREIDRLATDEFGISLAQMMELAGAGLARLAVELIGPPAGVPITVLAGHGNNGGGGLVAARHMANRGADIRVILAQPVRRLRQAARERLATLLEMGINCSVAGWDLEDGELERLLAESKLIIDALLGYAARGVPHGVIGQLVGRLNGGAGQLTATVLSLDLPSGLDPDTGAATDAAVCAAATLTIALPKAGLLTASGRTHSGALYLVDVGLPMSLYRRMGLEFEDPFPGGPVVRLD